MPNQASSSRSNGFTLIELSIVLVVIGLIIGGVLVGQDLIRAAATRAQLAQIEKYTTAVHTFQTKYAGYLPGDIPNPYATQFGFQARGPYAGQGDGNGIIQGNYGNNPGNNFPDQVASGEQAMFWVDLSTANMMDSSFTTATPRAVPPVLTGTFIGQYFPAAKIGYGNYLYVYSGGPTAISLPNASNYFGLSAVSAISSTCSGCINSNANIPVSMAYNMDKKIDDGLPQSGNVTANYYNRPNGNDLTWAGTTNTGAAYNTATPGSSSTCFDNGGGTGPQQYSTEQSGGSGPNCALSFKIQ